MIGQDRVGTVARMAKALAENLINVENIDRK